MNPNAENNRFTEQERPEQDSLPSNGDTGKDSPSAERRIPNKWDRIFFLLSAVCGFFLFDFAFGGRFAVGVTVYFFALFLITGIYLFPWQGGAFPKLCGVLGIFLSFGFAFSADNTVAFFSFIGVELLYLLFAGGISGNLDHGTDTLAVLRDTTRIFFSESVSESGVVFRGISGNHDGGKLLRNLLKIVLGIIFAFPVLVIVLPLLISADGAFAVMLDRLPSVQIGRTTGNLVAALLLTPFTAGMLFSLKYRKKKPTAKSSDFRPSRGLDPVVISGFLGVLSACYLLYLFSQLGYFFSAFGGEIPESIRSASSYARRGFGEMCAISAINLLAIFITVSTMRRETKAAKVAGAMACFISVFSLILIATALSKMLLYIRFYGMSDLRILTSVFMVVLALCFVLTILKIFRPRLAYLRVLVLFCACVLILVSYIDIGAFTADYNVNAYLDEEYAWHLDTVDVHYLYDIGLQSAPALLRLYREAEDSSVRTDAKQALDSLAEYSDYADEVSDWRTFRVSRARGCQALDAFLKEK